MLGKAWVSAYDDICGTSDLLSKVLASRGVVSDADVGKFLSPSIKEYMPDPSVLKDMDVAASLIADAVQNHKKIAIYGDYDVDGIT